VWRSHLTKGKADIRRLAETLAQMCDLHDELDARVKRLEQALGIGPTGLLAPPH